MITPCKLVKLGKVYGWCEYHGMFHVGNNSVLASGKDDASINARSNWTAIADKRKNRSPVRQLEKALLCQHLGVRLSDEQVEARRVELRLAGVGCAACPSHLCSHPTAGPETKLSAKCLWCKEYQERDGVDPLEAAASVPWA